MIDICYLVIGPKGVRKLCKSRPNLAYNEVSAKVRVEVPNELFTRPMIEATIKIQDIPNTTLTPEIILNTKELIEQQTGAKIEFRIINPAENEES